MNERLGSCLKVAWLHCPVVFVYYVRDCYDVVLPAMGLALRGLLSGLH